jgi:hypothetical protein
LISMKEHDVNCTERKATAANTSQCLITGKI